MGAYYVFPGDAERLTDRYSRLAEAEDTRAGVLESAVVDFLQCAEALAGSGWTFEKDDLRFADHQFLGRASGFVAEDNGIVGSLGGRTRCVRDLDGH
jgi:hypothetical protein